MRAVDQTSHAHPSILQSVSTEHIIKLVRFGIWSKFMVKKGEKFNDNGDVLKAELEVQGDSQLLVQVIIPLTSLHVEISPNSFNT